MTTPTGGTLFPQLYCVHGRLHCLTCSHSAYYPK